MPRGCQEEQREGVDRLSESRAVRCAHHFWDSVDFYRLTQTLARRIAENTKALPFCRGQLGSVFENPQSRAERVDLHPGR